MGDFVRWCQMMFPQYQAWLMPGVLVGLAVIGLILLYRELRQASLERKKWEAEPRALKSHRHGARLKAS
jgi:ABC-type dipeptide/oligopeptide/nickel transport system permease subunit